MSDERLDEDVPYHGGEATERAPAATGTSGGKGESPDPNSPPRGSAPGTAADGDDIAAARAARAPDPEDTSAVDAPSGFKDVLNVADAVTSASGSIAGDATDDEGGRDV